MGKTINLILKIWRQKDSGTQGKFETYKTRGIDVEMSFLDMLRLVNERLTLEGRDPVAFNHDCREGVCAACGAVINGQPYGPVRGVTLCQLLMSHFKDEETLFIEPWRAKALPIIKDLTVDLSAFDRIVAAGGLIPGSTMNDLQCTNCGACVAACPNASAMLFVAAKAVHLNTLLLEQPEKQERLMGMVKQMDQERFGNCSNSYECEAACPKKISVVHIAQMNKNYLEACNPFHS